MTTYRVEIEQRIVVFVTANTEAEARAWALEHRSEAAIVQEVARVERMSGTALAQSSHQNTDGSVGGAGSACRDGGTMSEHWIRFKMPDDAEELWYAEHGEAYRDVLRNVDDLLRSKLKYGVGSHALSEETRTQLQEIRDCLIDEARGLYRDDML